MFVRHSWKPQTEQEVYSLIDANPWALLVNNGEDGPYATNLPLLLDRSRGNHGFLVGHLARANEHARVLQNTRTRTLAIFEGPSSYVTASWYPKRDMPSTYYYTAVHCYGSVRFQTEPVLEQWLELLTNRMEAGFPNAWKMTDIEHSEITRRLPLILGFEIEIQRIEGKFKLGQDEPKKDAMAVCEHVARSAQPACAELAEMIRRHNQGRPES
ncbi:MAG TPA: FMN-binding negative transcriptional regulator [Candidatus Acidoferrales bacterium]|nr:FMN-binding negative transcriptional regulator [Candidatus Acidoferrales bacterium]